jgi:hypothetical protein
VSLSVYVRVSTLYSAIQFSTVVWGPKGKEQTPCKFAQKIVQAENYFCPKNIFTQRIFLPNKIFSPETYFCLKYIVAKVH